MAFHGNPTFPDDDDTFGASISAVYLALPPITDASTETLYQNELFEFPAKYPSGYNLEAPSLASESTSQWPGIYLNSLPGSAGEGHFQLQAQAQGIGTNLACTSANTGYGPNPWTQLQRAFLQFLVRNRHILQTLPDSTPCSIAQVKQAFEQNNLTFDHSADLDKIIQQFKPQVSTTTIRHESDLKKKDTTSMGKFLCPFRFCDGHFTRGVALQNHLGAHFRLKPCRCNRCGNYYSDTAFDRHIHGCKA